MHENGDEKPAPEIRWQTKALPDAGYEVHALIPLDVFNMNAQTSEFLMTYAIAAAPAADMQPKYFTLHYCVSAYMDNSGFGRMIVK